jgi:hypothetical protein
MIFSDMPAQDQARIPWREQPIDRTWNGSVAGTGHK